MSRSPAKPRPSRPQTAQETIRQSAAFSGLGHEAVVTLLLAQDAIDRQFEALWAEHAVTQQQFNVLRILRGSRPDGLKTLEIAERMVQRTPGITRLLDRLEAKGLVARERSAEDRRQVWCQITKSGLAVLRKLDAPIRALDERVFAGLTERETRTLIRLLNKLRHDC